VFHRKRANRLVEVGVGEKPEDERLDPCRRERVAVRQIGWGSAQLRSCRIGQEPGPGRGEEGWMRAAYDCDGTVAYAILTSMNRPTPRDLAVILRGVGR